MSTSRRQPTARARRRAFFETLEARTVMAPLGAMPDDTGDYMLGDVLVTVVLMESDPTQPGADASTEDWTQASIDAVKSKVQQGMDYWKQTFLNLTGDQPGDFYYNAALPLLNFKYDWTWADNPVETLYEPISRYSSYHELWINDFLNQPDVDFANSLDIYKDVKAFNHFQRETHNTDWAFTIFVANSTNDADDFFPLNPSPGPGEVNYRGAFAFLGGQFLVIPSDRPATTFAHETGHIFYALDEYSNGHSYYQKAGYYNAQNLNGANQNPQAGFLGVQEPSIMATGTPQQNAWLNFVTSSSSKANIGWQDTDGDGVLDVLDVPFTLTGTGSYNAATQQYKFKGSSTVQTLKNENTFGGQHADLLYNDITINKIRRAEYSLDGGDWTTITNFDNTPTKTSLDLTINGITPGPHIIKIRTFDQRTGASSVEFVGTINPPSEPSPPQLTSHGGGISGFAFRDDNGNGLWDAGEHPLQDWGVELRTIDDTPLTLIRTVEPNDYVESTILNTIQPGVTLTVIGATSGGDAVMARASIWGGKIFYASSGGYETFTTQRDSTGNNLAVDRRLKAEFTSPVTSVSLKAIGSSLASVARLDAYDANNNLIGRYTTGPLSAGQSEVMTITHAVADIKYVIASGHLETEVLFDSLIVGPQTATTTNADGSFDLSALPAGTYNLKVLTAPNYNPISPLDGRATITVAPNSTASNNLYFAFQFGGNPWHNLLDPLNTNGEPGITAFDALIIINYLNLNPTGNQLIAGEAVPGMYIDVNNDNMCTAFDALAVINYLNANPIGGGNQGPEAIPEPETPEPIAPINSGNTGGGGGGERTFTNADEYFATNPIHISQRFKDDAHIQLHTQADHNHDHHEEADHDDHAFESFSDAESHHDHHDEFFTSIANNSPSSDRDLTTDSDSELVATSTSPLTSNLLSLLERLRRLQLSANRDGDQLNPRLTALRTALGEELDVLSAGNEQLSLLRQLLQRNRA